MKGSPSSTVIDTRSRMASFGCYGKDWRRLGTFIHWQTMSEM